MYLGIKSTSQELVVLYIGQTSLCQGIHLLNATNGVSTIPCLAVSYADHLRMCIQGDVPHSESFEACQHIY